MAPLVKEFKKHNKFDTKICVAAQHREMLDQVLEIFDLKLDYDLDIMKLLLMNVFFILFIHYL